MSGPRDLVIPHHLWSICIGHLGQAHGNLLEPSQALYPWKLQDPGGAEGTSSPVVQLPHKTSTRCVAGGVYDTEGCTWFTEAGEPGVPPQLSPREIMAGIYWHFSSLNKERGCCLQSWGLCAPVLLCATCQTPKDIQGLYSWDIVGEKEAKEREEQDQAQIKFVWDFFFSKAGRGNCFIMKSLDCAQRNKTQRKENN